MNCFLGYDAGGDNRHGVAVIFTDKNFKPIRLEFSTEYTAETAVKWFIRVCGCNPVKGIGADTLTAWSSSKGGLRPADIYLRENYSQFRPTILSPNSLRGGMVINGILVLQNLLQVYPNVSITETHPRLLSKVLEQKGNIHSWIQRELGFEQSLRSVECLHSLDAIMSAIASIKGKTGVWKIDLHKLPKSRGKAALNFPIGKTAFFWPDKREALR